MPRIQGVYKITNVRTTETSIGSSVDITRRWADHRRELRLGIHKNSLLQAAFACDGVRNFAITTLELVDDVEHLVPREQHYLETLGHSTITAKLQYEHLIEHGAVMRLTESGFGARLTNRQKAVGYGKGHS